MTSSWWVWRALMSKANYGLWVSWPMTWIHVPWSCAKHRHLGSLVCLLAFLWNWRQKLMLSFRFIGGRFLFAYQIMTALAIYLMTTAVMDQSPSFMLNYQTRMLLSIGVHTSPHETLTTLSVVCTCFFLTPVAPYVCSCPICQQNLLMTCPTHLNCLFIGMRYSLDPCTLVDPDNRLTIAWEGTMYKLCSSTYTSMTHLYSAHLAAASLLLSAHAINGTCLQYQPVQ